MNSPFSRPDGAPHSSTNLIQEDWISAAPIRRLSALLDRDDPEPEVAPPLAHWLYFAPEARQGDLGEDGHPRPGDFLPRSALPRRMWAAGAVEFVEPIAVGRPLTRRSRVSECTPKTGRSGEMLFVTVDHDITCDGRLHLKERQTIVYREAMRKGGPASDAAQASAGCDAERAFTPNTRHLFRFSALTFNTHRIHFDLPYATDVEGYPGLVVQGPFVATLLMDLLRRTWPQAAPLSFRFRAVSPVFVGDELVLRVRQTDDNSVNLWAANDRNFLSMEAQATVAFN